VLHLASLFRRTAASLAVFLLVVSLVLPLLVPLKASAGGLVSQRSLKLSSTANGNISTNSAGTAVPAGEGGNGAKAKHTVTFTMATSGDTVGSIIIMYCDSPILQNSCNTPTGMTAANLTSVTVSVNGTPDGSFTLDTATTDNDALNNIAAVDNNGHCNVDAVSFVRENCVVMRAASGAVTFPGSPVITIEYGGGSANYIKNPTSDNYSFYARILLFDDTGYTTLGDYGGLAAATAQQVDILAKVQEILNFSVGVAPEPRTPPACTPIDDTDSSLTLGDSNSVLSTLQAYDGHSYFRVNTNTVNGTKIFYSGRTLESGIADINPIAPVAGPLGQSSSPGTEQFGLAIDQSDTDPGGGSDNDGYSFTDLTKTAPYAEGHGTIVNAGTAKFAFETSSTTAPKEIASSTGGIACDTGSVRYIANVSTSTPAGIYRTTLTYIALGTY
jgi:hypothetical protein